MSAPSLRFGYGTNGMADHRLDEALALLAELGYAGVALTLDHQHLDPYADDLDERVRRIAKRLDELRLSVVVETGGRYVLDPRRKHKPTLLSDDGRERRLDLLRRAIRIGADLGAEAVSFWSGTPDDETPEDVAWERLVQGCAALIAEADRTGVQLGFEPEPGMLVDDLDAFDRLSSALGGDPRLGLTLDIGHCRCLETLPVADCVRRAGDRIVNVQIEDMVRGVHEHLPFGEGDIDFPPVLAALVEVGYSGLVSVELPRHSHAASTQVARSIDFLQDALREAVPQ